MSIFGKLFGGGDGPAGNAPGMPDRASMMAMMKDPAMRKLASELQSRLTPAEQQELMRLVMSRDTAKLQEFMQVHMPDLESMMKGPEAP